jgi:glutathione S-transferase
MGMTAYSMENQVFVAYTIAAAIMILKVMGQGWMTVFRMMNSNAGLLNPEDLIAGPTNRNPHPSQLELNDYVDRSRRIHRNDLENIPAFLVAGLLFVAVQPAYWLAVTLMATFVVARLVHTAFYVTAQRHEVRSVPYTIGSIVVIVMAFYVLVAATLMIR